MTIEEYLNTTIDTINNSLSDSEILRISDEISQKLCEYKNYYGERESLTNKIYSLLLEYNSNTNSFYFFHYQLRHSIYIHSSFA